MSFLTDDGINSILSYDIILGFIACIKIEVLPFVLCPLSFSSIRGSMTLESCTLASVVWYFSMSLVFLSALT